ncbi:hypothetical protein Daura_32365 [Dactylosporangium aurantiacum]|uniref:HTH cro/C1-type domain-containing protein n=1 Tax=Dactylosporangium aurantiacum TaxID=35754 RepID=A0A9Q9MGA8_9ACTN|nr:hypothetical protein [Dactylosporangium aurantiacum]MDG6107135.1 hypothetical protein [Dactylosporangium aurantiacum]UWZ51431.1 hypothetical protein Daura_32365 [Dactylosporangium aurantiacum]
MTDGHRDGAGVPDPARIVDRAQFAGALTAQRERAGLTVRQVAAQAGARHSVSTVGDWFSGRGLPSLSSQPLLVRVLEVCAVPSDAVEAWLAAWRRVRRRPAAAEPGEEPYRGLASFEPGDARWFFGRDRLTARLRREVESLRAGGGGLLLLVGASGSGKSSLLRAGLVASLRSRPAGPDPADPAAPDGGSATGGPAPGGDAAAGAAPSWVVEVMTPGADPLAELARRAATVAAAPGPALLVVDQAEELFTLAADHAAAVVGELARLCAAPTGAVVVVALRADFYAQALRHPLLLRAAQRCQFTVGPMTRDELRSVIVGPADRAGTEVEPGLVELLLADVAGLGDGDDPAETAALPLLSHALSAMWRHDEGRRMTHAAYRQVGGVRGAVAATASAVYDGLGPAQQEVARRLLTGLVHLGEDTVDTRRVVPTAALLAECATDADAAEAVLERFVQHRLVTAEADTVQLSHEALLSAWPRLRGWLRADRAGLLIRQQLTTAAAAWQADGHDPNALYRGTRLAAAQGWAAEHPALLSPPLREFLRVSTRHARRRTRRLQQTLAALSALTVVMLLLAGYAFQQRAAADTQRQAAVAQRNAALSRMIAGRADWLRGRDTTLSRQLALAAYRVAPTVEARSSLLDAAATLSATRLPAFSRPAQAVVVLPGRQLLAAAGTDHTVRLWSTATATPSATATLTGPADALYALAASPDGRLLAAAGADDQVFLWRLDDPARPEPLPPVPGPAGTVYALAFSPDGHTLVAGSAEHVVHRWRVTGGTAAPLPPLAGADGVQALAFGPDGRVLAAGGADRLVHLWDLAAAPGSEHVAALPGHTGKVLGVAFSADGRLLASGSSDQTVRLWDVTDPRRATPRGVPLTGPTSWVNAVTFSPDAAVLVAGSSDRTVLLYDVGSGRVLQTLPHPAPVTAVALTPDGHTLVSSSTDGYVRVWPLPGPLLTGPTGGVFATAFSPDGATIAVASRDETIRLWHPHGPPGPMLRRPEGGYAGTAAFSPDGRLLAAGTRAGDVDLWDVHEPDRPVRLAPALSGAQALVEAVAFAADGALLAVGGDDGNLYLWDVATPRRPALLATVPGTGAIILSLTFHPHAPVLAATDTDGSVRLIDVRDPARPAPLSTVGGFAGYAYSAAFSPDGRLLAVGGGDKTVQLWTVADPAHPVRFPAPLLGPTSYVYWVTFDPTGGTLATASTDGTVWLWDVTTPARATVVATLGRADPAYYTAVFSPDGAVLAAGSDDGTTRLWGTDPARAAAEVCRTAGVGISRAEWDQYVPGAPYSPPC